MRLFIETSVVANLGRSHVDLKYTGNQGIGKFVILRYDKKFFIEYAKLAARIQQKSQVENLSKCSW